MSSAVRIGCWLFAIVGMATLSARAADEGVTLRWKFTAGQSSKYVTSQEVKVQMRQGGKPQDINTKQSRDMTWTVDSVDEDGNAHITQVIERIRAESAGFGDETKFDSNDDKPSEGADDPSLAALRIIVHEPVHLIIDPRGKVVDVRLSESFSEKLKQSPHYGALAPAFSRDSVKQMTKINTLELPAGPLSKGAVWDQQTTISDPAAGRQKLLTTYRYDGPEQHDGRELEKISATAKIALSDEKKPPQRITVKDQKSNGVIWFDRAAGRIQEMQTTAKIVTELSLGQNKVEQTMTTTTHVRLVE